ncbi:MAG TPA: dTDP-4-amino-4,6-dideoxygalactose transaminase [Pirellulales bacterium]
MLPRIPFNKPFIAGKEMYYIAQAVAAGKIAGDGHFTQQCARLLEREFDIPKVLMTPSCTAALEMAAILCDLRAGDEVILPSYTFVSTANAFVRLGAKPVFVDVRRDTLNIDEDLIEDAITPRTKAICPVHYAGVGCDMNRIMEIAERHGLLVVEDAAQGVNATYEDRALGAIGHLGAYSFHETKNYVCGEGGALCINTPELIERAEIIREKGTNRSRFFRGMVDKYTWVDVGSSYVPSELCSAFLLAQLEMLAEVSDRRRMLFENYERLLKPLAAMGLLSLAKLPATCQTNYHMFYVLLPDCPTRDALMASLKQDGIGAVFHYVPLHLSPMGESFGYRAGDLPVTENLAGRLLRLPFYFDLSLEDQHEVVAHVTRFATASTVGRAAA